MILQYIIVGIIICTATIVSLMRMVSFFRTPVSKCSGCSGCKLEELKVKKGTRGR